MFTQRKRNYKTFIYTAIILTLCFLIIAIAWPREVNEEVGYSSEKKVSTGVMSNVISDDNGSGNDSDNGFVDDNNNDNDDNSTDFDEENQCGTGYPNDEYASDDDEYDEEEDNFPISKNSNITGEEQSYYLVKRAGDAIKVFFIDRSGNEVELETTNILYNMLGYEDQALFDQGYKVSSQEELAVLLQDFES